MNAPARRTPAEIKFRVDPAEKAQADRIAASVGMDTNAAMKVMFKRFLAARGFPFDMKATAGEGQAIDTPFGASLARLAQVSAVGFAAAARAHERAGRRPPAVAARRRSARQRG